MAKNVDKGKPTDGKKEPKKEDEVVVFSPSFTPGDAILAGVKESYPGDTPES